MLRGLVTPVRPHGSVVVGSFFAILTAAGLKSAGSIRLLTNGALSVRAPRVLHAADATCVKSPASMAGVGTNRTSSDGRSVVFVPW
jgi:hypothetical protein